MDGKQEHDNVPSNWELLVASLKAFHAGDMEAALAPWADDAVVRLIGAPPGERNIHEGKTQIRAWLSGLHADHFEIQEELLGVDGDILTVKALSWSDATRGLGVAPLEATEVYVIRDAKIRSLSWSMHPESLARLMAAVS